MLRKQTEQLVIETLKFFFNFDHVICNHILLMLLIAAGLFKLFFIHIVNFLSDGVNTVKEDYAEIKAIIISFAGRVRENETYNTGVNSVKVLLKKLIRPAQSLTNSFK